jgi:hypothetical protein
MGSVTRHILVLALAVVATPLAGCTAHRQPITLIEPSYSYLRMPQPPAGTPLVSMTNPNSSKLTAAIVK